MTDDQRETIAFLSNPTSHGLKSGEIERIETHISLVFLAGDRVYELKRAVRLPYVDFSTAARRRDACAAELALNRRTAALTLRAGYSAIVDAVALKPEERRSFAAVTRNAGVPFTGLWLEAPQAALTARVAARRHDASARRARSSPGSFEKTPARSMIGCASMPAAASRPRSRRQERCWVHARSFQPAAHRLRYS